MGKNDAIVIQSLYKNFGHKQILSDVNLNVPYGAIFGFLGPNGAGKTTTIRCLLDFIRPTSGSINMLGLDAHTSSADLKRSIGFLSSDSQLNLDWTGEDHITFCEAIKGKSQIRDQLVKRFGLDTKTKVRKLSSGNRQKLAIVLCFIGSPQLLIMDEPTRGLDPLLQNELYTILDEFIDERKSVFLSSHNLAEVERICNSVALIKDGKIIKRKTMADIREMKVHIISVSFTRAANPESFKHIENVEVVSASKNSLTIKVAGDINAAMQAILGHRITDLSVDHVSLEDIFLGEYREEEV